MLKNKIADFFMVAADGYEAMSTKEAVLWYMIAVPANIAYYKLLRQGRYGSTVALSTVLTGALLARSFTLGLRARRDFWGEVLREHQAKWEAEHGGPPANIKLS